MKIAVYTIAKNEEKFVQRWADSTNDADYRLILDTGSTDGSQAAYERAFTGWASNTVVAHKTFDPWRFDTARNYALSLLPHDIDLCIALDMDEVLQSGWRAALEKVDDSITRPRYKYVWSWTAPGVEGLVYGGDKIHRRHGYFWKHPVHETLKPIGGGEVIEWVDGLEIHHHPDPTKSRSQYLPLLELAVEEEPNDDRNCFYLAREYFFHGRHAEAARFFRKHLELSTWAPERAASHRYLAKIDLGSAEMHLYHAISEDPRRRESWVDLALLYHSRLAWLECLCAAQMALRIETKPLDYLCEELAWGATPYDLAALASHHLGDSDAAFSYGAEAVARDPQNERLRSNMEFYRTT